MGEHEKEAYDKLEVYQSKGVVVRAKAPIPKGTLTLAIASQRLDQKKANGSFRVCTFEHGGKTSDVYALPHNTLPLNKDGEPNAKPWVNHFWMVQLRDEPQECNMDLKWMEDTVGEFTVRTPILVNRRIVKAGETLKRKRLESDPPAPSAKKQAT